jgi:hypothetical protein
MDDDRTLWAVGEEGCILVSTNLGQHWNRRSLRGMGSGWDDWLNACGFAPNGKVGWIVGAQGLAMVLVQIRRIEHREAKVFPLSLNVGAP